MTTKRDLRATLAGSQDRVGEWGRETAASLVGLHPFDIEPEAGATLPAPHEDRFGNDLGTTGAGDSVYYLTHGAPLTLGNPVMRPGRFDGQRVRLSAITAAFNIQAGAARGAPVTVDPGRDATVMWDAARKQWVVGAVSDGAGIVPPIEALSTAEMNPAMQIAPDGAGGVVWTPTERGITVYSTAPSVPFTGLIQVPLNVAVPGSDPAFYTHTPVPGHVTVLQAGIYEASYHVAIDKFGPTGTTSAAVMVTPALVQGSVAFGVHRGPAVGEDTITISPTRVQLAAGAVVTLLALRWAGGGTLQTVPIGCAMTIRKVLG
ncbi:MAG: hypothetical protein CL819_01275 [Croceicoccus sp.]|nr:hypothetical protein [Croceicoccus sp.]